MTSDMTADILTPAEIGEFLSLDQCSRFFKHRIDGIDESEHHDDAEYSEAFTPLNLLLAEAGELFEQGVKERFEREATAMADFTDDSDTDDEEFDPDHEAIIDKLADCVSAPPDAGYRVLFQPTLKGEIAAYDIAGHADFVLLWPTTDGAAVRVVDAKSTSSEKSYQQIQAAIYTRLIEQVVESSDAVDAETVDYSAGVVTRNVDSMSLTPETTPAFDYESRVADVTRLLQGDGAIAETAAYDLETAPHAINQKCGQCPYTESCTTEAFEELHVRLLGLSESEQAVFEEHGITSIGQLADLCREPRVDDDEWNPTLQKRAAGVPSDSVYHELKSDSTVGEQLPQLVYRAQAIYRQITDRDEYQNGLWIPGTGECQLPEDDPFDPNDVWFEPNSMIRVYLNVQKDHLRDRLIQLNARISISDADIDSIRITELANPDDTEQDTDIKWAGVGGKQSHGTERDLLRRFIERVTSAIESVATQVQLPTQAEQQHPLLQFYTYTGGEIDALQEALHRVSQEATTPAIDAFADTLEGKPGVNTPRIVPIKPELNPRFEIPTTSYGLLHVYAFMPPRGNYRKPRTVEEWAYNPSHHPDGETVDIRSIFGHRLFNTDREWEYDDGKLTVDPTAYPDPYPGVKTRYRTGAEIPLGYLWSAVDRIDEQWIDDVEADIGDEASQITHAINNFLYHTASEQAAEIRPEDVNTLGKHLVDMLEHVERGAIYRNESITVRKRAVDPATLSTGTRQDATVAEAARDYLTMEHTAQQQETYEHYRKLPIQRVLSGESLPVRVESIDEDAGDRRTTVVTGELLFDHRNLFDDNAKDAKLACKRKGKEESSGGDRMVANVLDQSHSSEAKSPRQIEMGIKTTIRSVDLKEDTVEFAFLDSFGNEGKFDTGHRSYTASEEEARASDWKTHISRHDWLILDPTTANFPADKADKALETADQNAVHELIEGLRWGEDVLSSTMFDQADLDAFADWLKQHIWAESYPNDRQRDFITLSEQVGLLQGPPGTGKTAGTIAPTICGRLFAAGQTGRSLSGLVTAPSNTAVDEMLEDTVELVQELSDRGVHGISEETVDIVRIAREKPPDPEPGVEYLYYYNDDDLDRIREIRDTIKASDEGVITETTQDSTQPTTDGGQATIGVFDEATTTGVDVTGDGPPASEQTHTLVFATPTSSWGLLKEFAGSGADPPDIAEQSLWDVLIADEASMLTLPKLILAGAGLKSNGQLLLGGDHRQLPPVQKYDWDEVHRQSIARAAPYLSALNYFRLLGGDLDGVGEPSTDDGDEPTAATGPETPGETDVLSEEQRDRLALDIAPKQNPIPLIQLNKTFRFGSDTADFIGETVYQRDDIDYSADDHDTVPRLHQASTEPIQAVYDPAPVTVITYDSETTYQQVNIVEALIAIRLLADHSHEAEAGVVTPHNAQRTRLKENLRREARHMDDSPIDLDGGTQVETVNRFQGGQKDIMVVSATASNPQFIRSESDFLLQLNRANVAFSRHEYKLVVVMSESLLAHIPTDTDTYDESLLWKSLSQQTGQAPTVDATPYWRGTLAEFLKPKQSPQESISDTELSVYHL